MADAAAALVENLEGTDVEVVKVRKSKNSKSMVKDQENAAKKAFICCPGVKEDVVMLDASSGEACGASRSDINAENMVVDGSPAQSLKQNPESAKMVKGLLKRKRVSIEGNLAAEDMESLGRQCRRELDDLFEYYKEFSAIQMNLEAEVSSNNHMIACLLEESNLSFSKLVEEIYEKLKGREGITLASVKTSILYVGQRMIYGISKNEADVLEDTSDSCLWCWETRDMKLLPMNMRKIINIRRTARKKISERITALSGTLSLLSAPNNCDDYRIHVLKSSEKLGRTLNEAAIRSLVERLKQKNDANIAAKEGKLREKEIIKEVERNKQTAEKERKRLDRELQKEKIRSEKEFKRLKEESEKVERRREKEEADLKRQLKRQQEEAERDQKRRQKEETESKKQLSIQKQATIMERFLKSKKNDSKGDNTEKVMSTTNMMAGSSVKSENFVNATTSTMDATLSQQDCLSLEEIFRAHVAGWHKLSQHNRTCRWGVRHNPKMELVKELKIGPLEKPTTPNKLDCSIELGIDNLVDGCDGSVSNDISCFTGRNFTRITPKLSNKKLLQFDKSHRPAYYGTWSQKSTVVGPRRPLQKEPNLDYDVDSDEEWEEEDPGESLSDIDKDDEEETLDEGNMMNDDDEAEDGFFVPDGYLSENEGIQSEEDKSKCSPCSEPEAETEEFRTLLRHQKYLCSWTDQALKKCQPLIISNLMHEKTELLMTEDLAGTAKLEQICLQAICMRACPGSSVVEIPANHDQLNADHEISHSQKESFSSPITSMAAIQDGDLPKFVSG
ncbi:Chromatin assembly factor 1 subunit A protein [Dioscorea alata]|uniref:Chromatin assembly factor 1 subunit A protein n=1 Tax=Dioscorea alata TaxID=55571 RepID=A0ACB7WAY9_DIOAL|nr:Chromatin assembly factor 1 subunit A protein [Dioscorea alata]